MALPQQIKTARMTDATQASTIDNEAGNIEQAIADILGIPVDTNITKALFAVVAGGLNKVILQDLAGDPAAAGELARNGTRLLLHDGNAARMFPVILDRDVTSQEVINTTTETTIYSFTVPANTLGSDRAIRLTLIGDHLKNIGGADTITIRIKFGATTIFSSVLNTGASADRRAILIEFFLSANNATNAQVASTHYLMGTNNTVGGAGTSISADVFAIHNSIAEDTTGALALVITFEHSAADAALGTKVFTVQTELL